MNTKTKTAIISCLIDDDFIHQFGMKRMIQRYYPSTQILEFYSGLEAINFFKNNTDKAALPEIIFLDINMPIMNGWEFLEEFGKLRSSLKKKIDIYLLSSSTDKEDIDRAKSNSLVIDYIVKPLTSEWLENIFPVKEKIPS